MPSLQIHPTPFRPSRLGIPPSPHSPRSPLADSRPRYNAGSKASRQEFQKYSFATSPPPSTPLHWVWRCHLCSRSYPVGVTRRCLWDGHYFCAGEPSKSTTTRSSAKRRAKQRKRGKACASEYDYQGWTVWGEWRRKELAARDANSGEPQRNQTEKDCEHRCDYPSDCRWRTHPPPAPPPAPTSFEEILGLLDEDRETASTANADAAQEEPASAQVSPGDYSFWTSLLDSAKTRIEGNPPRASPPIDQDTIMLDADSSSTSEPAGPDGEPASPTFSETSSSASSHIASPCSPAIGRAVVASAPSPLHYSRTYPHSGASGSGDGTLRDESESESGARSSASSTEEQEPEPVTNATTSTGATRAERVADAAAPSAPKRRRSGGGGHGVFARTERALQRARFVVKAIEVL